MLPVTLFPAVQGRNGDLPEGADLGDSAPGGFRLESVRVVPEDREDKEQGEVGEGDQGIWKEGVAVVAVRIASPPFAFPAFLAQAERDQEILIDPATITDVGDAAAVGGGLPGSPDALTATVAGVAVGVVVSDGLSGKLKLIRGREPGVGRYSNSLHWLILSLGTRKERSVSSPEHPGRVGGCGGWGVALVG